MNGGSCCFYELAVGRRGRQNFACKKAREPGQFYSLLAPSATTQVPFAPQLAHTTSDFS
jgi:hypothetical protein